MADNTKKKKSKISTILGENAELLGNLNVEGAVRIDGKIKGDIVAAGSLILGKNAYIQGNVEADYVMVGGEIRGNVTATQKLELASTARLLGDIKTTSLVIDEHAFFQGRSEMCQEMPETTLKELVARPDSVYDSSSAPVDRKSAKVALAEALREVQEGSGQDEGEEEEG